MFVHTRPSDAALYCGVAMDKPRVFGAAGRLLHAPPHMVRGKPIPDQVMAAAPRPSEWCVLVLHVKPVMAFLTGRSLPVLDGESCFKNAAPPVLEVLSAA